MPIFDQGYQHWQGGLAGHTWRWFVITRQGLRSQLRGSLLLRLLLFSAWLPAVALVVAICLWGLLEQGSETVLGLLQPIIPSSIRADPRTYRLAIWTILYSTFFDFELFFIMLLAVIAGPNLISRDLQANAFPLYFSRPLTRFDYFLGKLGVIALLVAAVAIVPALVAYLCGICFSLDLSVFRDTWRLPIASLFYGLIIVASVGTLMLAMSSLSRRSLYVDIAWIGLWLISSTVSSVLLGIQQGTTMYAIRQEMRANGEEPPSPMPPPPHRSPGRDGARPMPRGFPDPSFQRFQERVQQALAKEAPTNWRPLCSYTANLNRLGAALLDTDAAWVKIGEALAAPRTAASPLLTLSRLMGPNKPSETPAVNNRRYADRFVLQYPWTWSAGVLIGLFGLSLWILNRRVKSLDLPQ